MNIHITSRHFKPHDTLREHAFDVVGKLERYYNGIVRAEVILSFERARNSVKVAEIHVSVYGTLLKAFEKSDDFFKSIDAAIEKLEGQLKRYKGKLHKKEKREVLRVREKA